MPDNNTKGLSAQRELYKELSKLWVGVGILLEGEEGILMVLRDNIPNIQYPNHLGPISGRVDSEDYEHTNPLLHAVRREAGEELKVGYNGSRRDYALSNAYFLGTFHNKVGERINHCFVFHQKVQHPLDDITLGDEGVELNLVKNTKHNGHPIVPTYLPFIEKVLKSKKVANINLESAIKNTLRAYSR